MRRFKGSGFRGSEVPRFRFGGSGVQGFRGSRFRGSEVQGSEVQKFKVQRFRGSGVQGFRGLDSYQFSFV
ncbi:hypothetical protein D1AOALGA4SA_4157 [Olavius algarvensis Delta 1 endosymbiont]|nr:hypothetical protein D1AOALGA4SA_4157 [Olavius algarvensis Delta 1 endosymbiont]